MSAIVVTTVLLLAVVLAWIIVIGSHAYSAAAHTDDLESFFDADLSELNSEDFENLHVTLSQLQSDLQRLDRLTYLPGVGGVVERAPWVGEPYRNGRDLIQFAVVTVDVGERGSLIAADVLDALDENGLATDSATGTLTWLRALDAHRDELPELVAQFQRSAVMWESIDPNILPASAQSQWHELGRLFSRSDEVSAYSDDYDAFYSALGGGSDARYLVMFQNPAELRPSGGFPGTMGLFTFRDGQLHVYEIYDSHELTRDYMQNRSRVVDQPWPIETFFPQAGFIFHDANWYSEFPKTAAIMLEMWDEMSFPPIYGLIAVQPEVVSDMLRVTGPLDVVLDGDVRHVTPENVYEEVERNRMLQRAGVTGDTAPDYHKNILIQIGIAIMEEVKDGDRDHMLETFNVLKSAAERRDLQIYVDEPDLLGHLDRFGYSGRLIPDPDEPTLAVTFSNLVLRKSSLAMQPEYRLSFEPDDDGFIVTLDMHLEHLGRPDADPFYEGFQRWWIEVTIPDGTELVESSRSGMADPEAPNGGAYVVDLFQQSTADLSVSFRMGFLDQLLIRRQPGLVTPNVTLEQAGCADFDAGYLTRDLKISWIDGCPTVEHVDNEPRRVLLIS